LLAIRAGSILFACVCLFDVFIEALFLFEGTHTLWALVHGWGLTGMSTKDRSYSFTCFGGLSGAPNPSIAVFSASTKSN